MKDQNPLVSREDVSKIVNSVTGSGSHPLTELQAERLLNAITRLTTGTPTMAATQQLPDDDQLE